MSIYQFVSVPENDLARGALPRPGLTGQLVAPGAPLSPARDRALEKRNLHQNWPKTGPEPPPARATTIVRPPVPSSWRNSHWRDSDDGAGSRINPDLLTRMCKFYKCGQIFQDKCLPGRPGPKPGCDVMFKVFREIAASNNMNILIFK